MAQCLRPRRLIVAAALFSAFAFELLVAQTARESSPQIRQKTFDVVWKTVNDKSFDPRFGGVNWAAVHDRYAPLVAAVTSNRELFDLLDRMLKEIPISHLHLLELDTLDTLLARSVVTTGLALRDVDGQVLVTRVVDGSAGGKAGLRAGFVVKAIDDVAPATARAAEATLAGEKKPHRLTVLDDADTVRDFVIEHQLPPADKLEAVSIGNAKRYAFVESRRVAGGIGYIHFTNFIAPLKKKLGAAFNAMRTAPGIIIDLRGNSGGDTELGLALAGMLVEKETQLAIERTRRGDDYSYKAKPQKNPYRGPVVILLDQESASESEQVTAGLQGAGRVVVIGKRSRGEDMDATLEGLPIDAVALLYPVGYPRTPKGLVVEGHGVTPDIEVNLARAELLNGKDSQLDAAIRHIQELKR